MDGARISDEQLVRVAHESRALPLREALAQRALDLEEAEGRPAGRVLLELVLFAPLRDTVSLGLKSARDLYITV